MPATDHPRHPRWLRRPPPEVPRLGEVRRTLRRLRLHTVCEGARCPNRAECYGAGNATFMILGERCTRDCAFCSVPHGPRSAPESDEPARLAEAVADWGLDYVVITSVTRDDLPDGGAGAFAETVEALGGLTQPPLVELLIPDFAGDPAALERVIAARPAVLGHNVETVPRLYPGLRNGADYSRSLDVLKRTVAAGLIAKSGLMCGLGETRDELRAVFDDLAAAGIRILTLGQYLQPTARQRPVERHLPPDEFDNLAEDARQHGIPVVSSGPLVRSSYRARHYYELARSQE